MPDPVLLAGGFIPRRACLVFGGAHGFGTGISRIFVDVVFIPVPIVHFLPKIRASRLSGKLLEKTHAHSIFWNSIFDRIKKFVSS